MDAELEAYAAGRLSPEAKGALEAAGKALRGQKPAGRLALAGVRGMVREVFEMSGFLTLFPVADTPEAALAQLQA